MVVALSSRFGRSQGLLFLQLSRKPLCQAAGIDGLEAAVPAERFSGQEPQ